MCLRAPVAVAQRGLRTQPCCPSSSLITTHVVWELEGLVASLLPSAGLDERSWGLFTQDFQVQVFVLCLAHFSLAPILAHRRLKVRIDCPVTAGGYCLTGAGANILSI